MNKQDIYAFIKEKQIWYEITEHEPVFTMEELCKIKVPYPGCNAKNILVRDDKKVNYYLISVKGDKRVNLKDFQKAHDTRHLSFASADDLDKIMKQVPGSVSPLGMLNDQDLIVKFYLDQAFLKDPNIIGIHPDENTATIWLKTNDLIDIVKNHGNQVNIIEI